MSAAADARSLESVYQTALRCVQDGLGTERASLLLFDPAGTMRFVAWSGLSEEYRTALDGHSPWVADETGAAPILVPDVEADASLAAYVPVFNREGIRALAFVPLQLGPKLLGKFMLYYREVHAFSDEEMASAQQIADQVALALEHHKISVALDAQLVAEREIRLQAQVEAVQRHASERRLHLALAAGRMGTWDWDIASGQVRWSAELESIHGLEPGSFGGTLDAFRSDVHPADAARLESAIATAVEAPDTEYSVEYRIVRKDGACRWLEARGRVLVDGEGRPTRMVGVCRDTTERRQAEEARALLAGQLETLARVSDEIAGALDPSEALQQLAARVVPTFADYCITYIADEASIRPLGCAHRDPTKNALVSELAHARPLSLEDQWGPGRVIRDGEACLAPEFASNLAKSPNAPINDKHRALGTRSMMIVPLNARGHSVGAIAFVSTDDSERRFGQQELKIATELAQRVALLVDNARLYAEAKAAIRAREELIAVVSHDLRDPLQSISAAAAMLRLDPEHVEASKSIQSITLASTQMRLLVQDLLDMSLIDAGKFSITKDSVDLTALVKEAHTLCQPQAEERAVRLQCTLAAGLPPVAADRRRVLQVLLNLIGNALKFVPAGGAVTIGTEPQDDTVRIWVTDTGVGIAEEHLASVFDRFWSADRREGGGVGLGLAVAKGIVVAHGGRIGVSSRRGVGSTFSFTLPVHANAAEPLRVAPARPGGADRRARHPRTEPDRELLAAVNVTPSQRDSLLNTVAHELRNRLAPLCAELAVIRRESRDAETVAERCAVMDRQVKQLARLVDDLLDVRDRNHAELLQEAGGIEVTAVAQLVSESTQSPEEQVAAGIGTRPPTSFRILLVDDNRELALSLARFIHVLGHDIRVAFDGPEAMQVADEYRPDVMLVDIGLPKVSGYEIAREIRSKPWGGKMTLVAMTGWGRGTDRQRSNEAGFDRHLTKPVEPDELEIFLRSCASQAAVAG
jgi:PAS domain S-box-containing protein